MMPLYVLECSVLETSTVPHLGPLLLGFMEAAASLLHCRFNASSKSVESDHRACVKRCAALLVLMFMGILDCLPAIAYLVPLHPPYLLACDPCSAFLGGPPGLLLCRRPIEYL